MFYIHWSRDLQMKDLHHDNVNTFVGVVTDGGLQFVIVTEYCSKGSLQVL